MNFLKRIFDRWSARPEPVDRSPIMVNIREMLGDYPGERGGTDSDFLKMALYDALSRAERYNTYVVVNLDSIRGGYSSRFLNDVFADFGGADFYQKACTGNAPKLRFQSARDPSLVVEICGYMNRTSYATPLRTPTL